MITFKSIDRDSVDLETAVQYWNMAIGAIQFDELTEVDEIAAKMFEAIEKNDSDAHAAFIVRSEQCDGFEEIEAEKLFDDLCDFIAKKVEAGHKSYADYAAEVEELAIVDIFGENWHDELCEALERDNEEDYASAILG